MCVSELTGKEADGNKMKGSWEMRITFVLLWASIFLSFSSHSHSHSHSMAVGHADGDYASGASYYDNDTTTSTSFASPMENHQTSPSQSADTEALLKALEEKTGFLVRIDDISNKIMGDQCSMRNYAMMEDIIVSTKYATMPMEKVDLIVSFLYKLKKNTQFQQTPPKREDEEDIYQYALRTLQDEPTVESLRLVIYTEGQSRQDLYIPTENKTIQHTFMQEQDVRESPWFYNPNGAFDHKKFTPELKKQGKTSPGSVIDKDMPTSSYWTWPYFNCSSLSADNLNDTNSTMFDKGKWLASYVAWFPITRNRSYNSTKFGELSFDVDLSPFSINQCGFDSDLEKMQDELSNPLHYFRDTHKCDRKHNTTQCQYTPGKGWRLGSYECRCCNNSYAYNKTLNNTISGTFAESAWMTWRNGKVNGNDSVMYQDIVTCRKCPEGCDNCMEGTSCMAPVGWMFRLILLCVSIFCSIGAVGLVILTYKFRKLPVFKSSSPIFHCITLLGCMVMYSEMVALFPKLSQASCIAVKWTRHLGFSVTYTALYMKLCRVYLTFRVKSAHKIKLTEKHLLHWMSPIMVIMLLYLFAWTISDPPSTEIMYTVSVLKFHQCVYNWWDHALAIGEVIFLAYGVWICWRIRENPDAQYISYSIYNIAFVNVLMVTLHLLIVPQAGPDMKYLLAFVRTQLSTTVTIALVYGSKLCSVLRGEAASLKEIPNSANGFGHESLDLGEENQQLKEELQKMATQIERLKSYAMCKNNPHLKQSSANISTADLDFNRLDSFTTL